MARVNTEGQVLDPGGISVNGPTAGFSAGDGAGGIHMAWNLYVNDQSDIISAHISAAQVAGPDHTLSTGAPMQLYADVAVGSNGYMVVYRSDTASAHRIHAHPLDANGSPLTAEPIQLASGDTIYGPDRPSVAWNGSLYLVTWGSSSGIVAQRIQQDGTLVDAIPFLVIAAGFGPTDVSAVGDIFLVVGRKYGGYPQYVYGVASRVRGSDGMVLDVTPLFVGESYARTVGVTAFGGRWLMVWFSTYTHDDSVGSTAGNFVNLDGTLGTSFSIYGPYSMGGNGIIEVATASNGVTALVLQSAEVTSGVETDMVGRLVNADGTIQPAINLTPWAGNQYRPRAAWDGSQYVVAYTDQKNRFAVQTIDALDARGDLFGMRIAADGTVLDPQGFAFSNLPIAETHPNVIAAGGVSLFTGSIMRNEAPYAAYRVGYARLGVGGNQWPVAVSHSNAAGGDIPLNVQFDSTGSSDPDGTLAAYGWDFGDGSTSTSANPDHIYTAPGNFVVTLVVTDTEGAATTQSLALAVTAPNQLPVTTASANPLSGQAPLDVTFLARGSYDPDGRLGNFHWVFSDGTDTWGPLAYQTFYDPGIYYATLTAYDDRGGAGTDTITITVTQNNQAPVAAASATPLNGNAPLQVNFSSAGSYDPDGTLVSYAWDFGDGGTSTQANPVHTYTAAGSYQAVLTVTDNLGSSGSASVTISVSQAGNQLPAAAASATPLSGNAPLEVDFSSAGSYDPDGTLVSYAWDFGDGGTSTQANPVHTYATAGSYQAVLTVTDNLGLTGSASLTISVNGVALSPVQPAEGAPGEPVTYTLMVNYTGSEPEASFDVGVVVSGAQWTVNAPASVGPIPSGGSAPLTIVVHVPPQAAPGEQSVVAVTLRSQGDAGYTATALLTTLVPPAGKVELLPIQSAGSGWPGDTVAYTLTLVNSGSETQTFTLGAEAAWEVHLSAAEVVLAPGESVTILVHVTIPATARAKDMDSATIIATSSSGSYASANTVLTTRVNHRVFLPTAFRVDFHPNR